MPDRKKINIAFGTRPELIRFAPIIHALANDNNVELFLTHTGQHYTENMNEVFFRELNLPEPDVNLGIGGATPNEQMAQIISGMDRVLSRNTPDIVVVWGDTNSSLGVAIAANKRGIKLCHLEAGCRSHDFRMAEEYNRILIDHLSDLLFPLSKNDENTLKTEKVHGGAVFYGDPLYDVFLQNQNDLSDFQSDKLSDLSSDDILLTLHRAENVDNKQTLENILKALSCVKDKEIVFPIHPRTKKMIESFGLDDLLHSSRIKVIEPLSYFEILKILNQVDLVITDSGGLQKEAFFARKTCVTTRKSTEWLDTVRLGVNIVLDPETSAINKLSQICDGVEKTNALFETMSEQPYGDGKSTGKIVNAIIKYI